MMPASLQSFSYDDDGNLTNDGVWAYEYDAENRLKRMETTSTARTWGVSHRILEFRYDYLGRRIQKRVVNGSNSQEISSRRYLYDGWTVVAEYSAPGGTTISSLLRSYTWGLDLTGSLTAAGGVGALLRIVDHPSGNTYLPTYDGNGNVAALLNASSGVVAAAYEYSPYGEPIRAETLDSTVADQPYRFSTEFADTETGLIYYGYRFYSPSLGRFINRDPIEESGGINLYGFCSNNSINGWDVLGRKTVDTSKGEDPYGGVSSLEWDDLPPEDYNWGEDDNTVCFGPSRQSAGATNRFTDPRIFNLLGAIHEADLKQISDQQKGKTKNERKPQDPTGKEPNKEKQDSPQSPPCSDGPIAEEGDPAGDLTTDPSPKMVKDNVELITVTRARFAERNTPLRFFFDSGMGTLGKHNGMTAIDATVVRDKSGKVSITLVIEAIFVSSLASSINSSAGVATQFAELNHIRNMWAARTEALDNVAAIAKQYPKMEGTFLRKFLSDYYRPIQAESRAKYDGTNGPHRSGGTLVVPRDFHGVPATWWTN